VLFPDTPSSGRSLTTRRLPGTDLARFQRGAFVGTNVISLSDSAKLDAVVARTRGDETVREAASVFIDHAKTLIEEGGSMALLCARPKDLLAAVDNPTRPSASVPKSTAAQTKKSKTTKRRTP
jgi:hypothetical protein